MLFYLDNWLSADPEASPARRGAAAAMRPRAQRPNQRALQPQRPQRPQPAQGRMRGLNENYGRELLELHTLGVDGGYTQQDVVNVARAFTGWTIGPPGQPGFRFAAALHDRGEKRVLGQVIPAGGGIEDGERVLDILASHPATARHIAFKLAQRLVSDTPPQALVDRAAERYRATRGNLREVVRAIVTSPEFFAPDAYRAKVKTPFEFVVSALRATGAEVSSAMPVVRALQTLGMPLYLCQPPTGYDETSEAWVSSGALVNRMNFALELAGNKMRGVRLPLSSSTNVDALRTQLTREMFAGTLSASTMQTMARATTAEQTLALAIGAPEFQRQ